MISVIVPVYNVEKYINRCIDSIIAQTYRDLEIILVDDSSTDNSGSICDEYAQLDNRIKVIHKENGGVSACRNAGVEHATGEYISFVDSDDYIEKDMMELLISTIGNCDMATCGAYNDYVNSSVPQYNGEDLSFETDNKTAFRLILEGNLVPAALWNKLIKSSIAKNLSFPTGIIYEDIFYTNALMQTIKSARINTAPKYHYFHREQSLTTKEFDNDVLDIIHGYSETEKISLSMPEIKESARFRVLWAHFTVLDRMLVSKDYKEIPEYKSIVSFLKQNAFEIIKCPLFRKSRRISAIALKINVRVYKLLLMQDINKRKKLFR